MSSNYETLYGVGVLDDLHNYFPALLYDSSGFRSVQDVLAYIQSQTRNRFDLFSYGLREYQSRHPPPVSYPASLPVRRVVQTSVAVPSGTSTTTSTLLPGPTLEAEFQTLLRPATLLPTLNLEEDDEALNATNIAQTLLGLFRLPAVPLPRNTRAMDQFMQPVVVRPTAEQIEANTTIGNLVSDTDHSCAICQDTLTSEQEGRKLNACGHWFHRECIDTWLGTNVHCPVCRHDIREPTPNT